MAFHLHSDRYSLCLLLGHIFRPLLELQERGKATCGFQRSDVGQGLVRASYLNQEWVLGFDPRAESQKRIV